MYLYRDSLEASCRIKEFNFHSWNWMTKSCSSKMTETFTTAWTCVLTKVKLSLMRKILINYWIALFLKFHFFSYTHENVDSNVYNSVFFLIILVFPFANHKTACLDQSMASVNMGNMLSHEKQLLTVKRN